MMNFGNGIGNNMGNIYNNGKFEELAKLEHEQWSLLAEHMMNNMTPENIAKWKRQIATRYEDLTEEEKEKDREWADRVVSLLGLE